MTPFKQFVFFLSTAEDQTMWLIGDIESSYEHTQGINASVIIPGVYQVDAGGLRRVGSSPESPLKAPTPAQQIARPVRVDEQGHIFPASGQQFDFSGLDPASVLEGLTDLREGRVHSLEEVRASRKQ